MQPLALSAFIITLNEATRLPRTLAALSGWVGEIVVVDSGSTDATVEIARAAGARVLSRAFDGYGTQKRFAEEACRFDWLINVDADEVVTPALAREIASILPDASPGLYRLRILNVYPGDTRPRLLARDYNVVRLYHRSIGRYRDDPLFDRVTGTGPERQLKAPIWHHPFLGWEDFVAKQNRFTSFQARAARRKGRLGLILRLPFEAPYWFLRNYLGRGHILGGWKGFVFSMLVGFARFLRVAKMLESYPSSSADGATGRNTPAE